MTNKVSKVTEIRVSAKCSDLCWVELQHEDGTTTEGDGYVPDFFPGEHYGDYVQLSIDPETGTILNWKVPSDVQMVKDVKAM